MELRRVATTRLDALAKQAKAAIDAHLAETLTALVSGGLTTGEAHTFLDAIPGVAELMTPLSLPQLEAGG